MCKYVWDERPGSRHARLRERRIVGRRGRFFRVTHHDHNRRRGLRRKLKRRHENRKREHEHMRRAIADGTRHE